jgi:hypothetical protein
MELAPGAVVCSYCGRPAALSGDVRAPDDDATAAPVAVVRLLVDGRVFRVLAEGDEVVLGRMSADPAVQDALNPFDHVSRVHAHIRFSDGRVLVSDNDSTNGTRVDGRVVGTDPVDVTPPASLVLGERCVITVEVTA